jgi:hypothetical protein
VGAITAQNCGVIVDSTNSSALSLSFLASITASQIGVVGGGLGSGTGWTCSILCFFTPTPVNVPPLPDPLAYLAPPTPAPCLTVVALTVTTTQTVTPFAPSTKKCYNVNVVGSGITVTFNPGTYYAITVGAFAPHLVFTTGVYDIVGSVTAPQCVVGASPCGLSLTGVGATMCGGPSTTCTGGTGGVTFYLGKNAGSFTVNGIGNEMNLVAPTTGAYAGILFYQDRANASPACIGGCSGSITGILNFMQIEGALYFPDANLNFSGCCQNSAPGAGGCTPPYCSAYEIVVAKTITFLLDWFNDDYSSLPGDSPVRRTLLVE